MNFNINNCFLKTYYCGDKNKNYPFIEEKTRYTRAGLRSECLKKGFGAGKFTELKRNISRESLLNIKYVGPIFLKKFKSVGITSIPKLLNFVQTNNINRTRNLLERVFTDKRGTLNKNGYNSVLIFLYENGYANLPQCKNNN